MLLADEASRVPTGDSACSSRAIVWQLALACWLTSTTGRKHVPHVSSCFARPASNRQKLHNQDFGSARIHSETLPRSQRPRRKSQHTDVKRYTQTRNTETHSTESSYLKAGSSLLHLGGGDENAFLLLKSFWKRVGGILYQNKVGTEGLSSFQIQEQFLFLVTVSMGVTVI